MDRFVPLVAGTRGAYQEVVSYGTIAVTTGAGELLHSVGDVASVYPLRSTAKPFQLLPFLLDGLHEHGAPLTDADLAIMMSSHNGEDIHTARVQALLDRFELTPDLLQCGAHPPFDTQTRRALGMRGEAPTVLHSNCSGKHTAMLAVCRHNNWPLETYLESTHPLQQRIAELLCDCLERARAPIDHVLDGCSAPSWCLSLMDVARLFTRLYTTTEIDAEPRIGAMLQRAVLAATNAPHYVAGRGRLDTALLEAGGGRLFAKTGADGMYALALAPSPRFATGAGIAIKIADGDPGGRVREVVALELLRRLGVDLDIHRKPLTRNNVRGTEVGRYQSLFELI